MMHKEKLFIDLGHAMDVKIGLNSLIEQANLHLSDPVLENALDQDNDEFNLLVQVSIYLVTLILYQQINYPEYR